MKITKWVDMGQEVEVEVSTEDIRLALEESFAEALEDQLGEPQGASRIIRALSGIGRFLNALTDEQIALLNSHQRTITQKFLYASSERFKMAEPSAEPKAP